MPELTAGLETRYRQRRTLRTCYQLSLKFKKIQTGRPYSTSPVARKSFVTVPCRGLTTYTTLRPAVTNPVYVPEDLTSGDLFRISESEDEMQGIFKK
jgi:hypothetical protein